MLGIIEQEYDKKYIPFSDIACIVYLQITRTDFGELYYMLMCLKYDILNKPNTNHKNGIGFVHVLLCYAP